MTADSEPIKGYELENAVPVETGGLEVPIRWKHANAYQLPPTRHVRLEFQLKNAKLYSFWVR